MSTPARIPPLPHTHLAHTIARAVRDAGGRAWMVGGSVRDALLGRASKDVDLEVHGLTAEELLPVLSAVAPVQAVGRSFGVYKVGPGYDPIDVALPRAGEAAQNTHRGGVQGDPHMGLEAACQGRDLTINAIVADPLTGEVADPTGGCTDLAQRALRAVDPTRFGEDPLRVIRVARFAATHDLTPTPDLLALCRSIDTHDVATERISGEVVRALLRSAAPGRFLSVLTDVRAWDTTWPGLEATEAQLQRVDRAAALRSHAGPPPRDLALMLGAVLLDAPERAGVILDHLRIHKRAGFDVGNTVVRAIQAAPTLRGSASPDTALRRAAEVVDVAVAATLTESAWPEVDGTQLRHRASSLGVLHAPLAPLVYGRDLLDAGIPRGRILGELLHEIREHQLQGAVSSPEAAVSLAQRLWTSRRPSRV